MAYRDIRDYLGTLEAKGKLKRIQKGVDHTWELACLARWMFQAMPEGARFGMLFEQVNGFNIPVMTGILGTSRETYALALETESDQINDKWMQALLHPVPPRLVKA
ncbi:MAG: UbiD family decarboxylase, partial [Desulfobacterales bacterium]|nr:UbiD family decarboxylase [Desulfobacterales bacterium]